jgi:hypothetical protein
MTTLETSQLLYVRSSSNTQSIAMCVLVRRIGWMLSLTGNATYSPREYHYYPRVHKIKHNQVNL